ncbi:putative retrotransposon protein, partial [Tanacetum coccineum]
MKYGMDQEASGSLEDLEIIQEEDTNPSLDTGLNHEEDNQEIDEPQSDINPIHNDVWELVELPPNAKTVGHKWLFKKKTDMDGAVHTFKSCLVAKGFTQTYGVDYEETFSSVADIRSISAYIEKILKIYYMENSKRGTIPMQEKLKLSKSDGASTPAGKKASAVQWFHMLRLLNPGELHWTTVKNILKYLRNTKDMFLVYGGDMKRELRVSCYTDAGYLTDADDLKSQTGYVFVLNGGAVDWKSTKQRISATSSTYAEYIAAFDASEEAVWIHKFIYGLNVVPTIEEPITMYCDKTGAIAIANDHGVTKGARHFRAKLRYLREIIDLGDVRIEKVNTDDNLADLFTKALAFPKHSELTRKISLIPASSL